MLKPKQAYIVQEAGYVKTWMDLVKSIMPGPLCDYPYDTTRTAMSMVLNGVMRKYRKMKVILSHAGGFLPYAAYRFAYLWESLTEGDEHARINRKSAEALFPRLAK